MTEPTKVVAMPASLHSGGTRSPAAIDAVNKIMGQFTHLVSDAVAGKWMDGEVERTRKITYGAYNEPTYRAGDGTVSHGCGKAITDMRCARQYTHNAVELRCDALGLAVYVGGYTQINPVTKATAKGVRVAAYQHLAERPSLSVVNDSRALYQNLHNLLITSYNKIHRDYNLAGLTALDLTLTSERPDLMPNVCITNPL
jgi:hypothetical protein